MKQTLHNTLHNLTKFLRFYWRRTYSYPGNTWFIFKTFFAFPSSDIWQSNSHAGRDGTDCSQLGAQFLMLFFIWTTLLLCWFCLGFFTTGLHSPQVPPQLHASIKYLYLCLKLYSPAGLTMPDKLWDCDGWYQDLFKCMEIEAREMKLFVQVL